MHSGIKNWTVKFLLSTAKA